LVTGGCGFIGSNLVPHLIEQGNQVKVYDNLSRGRAEWVAASRAEVIRGDILDREALQRALEGIDAVVHLAAYGSVVESVQAPVANFDNNVQGTFNVLDCARLAGVRKVVFASTGGALIGNATPPVSEQSLPKPISPYGASKLCGEAYCSAFGLAYGMQTVALRFANVYGPISAHKKGAITVFIKALMTGIPITIYGDGAASRDFLYVEDLCRGIGLALAAELQPGTVMHLAAANEVTVKDLADALLRTAGKPKHPIEYFDKRPGEVDRNFARYDVAKSLLGFEPRWSFDDGLKATWAWFQSLGEGALQIGTSDS
jgi:UDP-glucose 4-epimerase